MSKAVLVMDMPSSCSECNFEQYGICHAVRKSIVGTPTDLKYKPDWCPLKPMPEKKETFKCEELSDIDDWYDSGYHNGYNALIDEILGD